LVEAIINANNGNQTYSDCATGGTTYTRIVLPKGTQTLTAVDNTTYGPTGLPVITNNITIEGDGAKIVRSKSAPQFRIFAVTGTLTIKDSTVSGGSLTGPGGAIYNYHGRVYVQNCFITSNTAMGNGGGIYTLGGLVDVSSSTISKNYASGSGGGV